MVRTCGRCSWAHTHRQPHIRDNSTRAWNGYRFLVTILYCRLLLLWEKKINKFHMQMGMNVCRKNNNWKQNNDKNVKIDGNLAEKFWFCFGFSVVVLVQCACQHLHKKANATKSRMIRTEKNEMFAHIFHTQSLVALCRVPMNRTTIFFLFVAKWKLYYSLNRLSFLMRCHSIRSPFKSNCSHAVSCT